MIMSGTGKKKTLLSGIQPSGDLLIGHYLGAIRNWVALQEDHDCIFMLVDLHAVTVRQEPAELRRRCYDLLALYLACGIDAKQSMVFIQSHVPAHAELAWILNCYAQMGELNRMTQFKDKSKKHAENINVGLFSYPVLMAADILLYGADLVPVGEDQKQHLELTRDIAQRFNGIYGDLFTIPEPWIGPVGARIMGLQDPTKKMSKSDENQRNFIRLLDRPEDIRSKIKKAVTDSGTEVVYLPGEKPALANLMTIYSAFSGDSYDTISSRYAGKGYADFKSDLADVVADALEPIQSRYKEIREDKPALEKIIADGAETANHRAKRILRKVQRKIGLVDPPS